MKTYNNETGRAPGLALKKKGPKVIRKWAINCHNHTRRKKKKVNLAAWSSTR